MRNFTFKGLFLTAVFMLLGCLSIQAANEELITKQITIKLDKAGTLPDKIASSEMYKITNLKITGEINGTDWKMIREMAGSNYKGEPTEGKLSVLDLSEARIVNGGGEYYCYGYNCYTSNDVIGEYAFKGCSGLTSLTLPAGITKIGSETFEGCSGLTSLNLPAGITSIGDYAFYRCSGLTSIYVYAEKVPKIDSSTFSECDTKKCTVYVPMGNHDDYRLSYFGYFENIVEFDATGIDKTTTSTDVEEVSRYSVNGQRLVGPTKGLNIVKYSDGSVKKVAVE